MAIDATEVIDTSERKKPDPNFPGRSIIITTVLHRDGTAEQWQRGEADPPDRGVKIGQYVDPDQRKQFESDRKADADAAKAAKPDDSPKTVTTSDGRVLQYVPADKEHPTGSWIEVGPAKAEKPAGPVEVGGQLVEKQPDGSYKPVYTGPGAKNPDAALPGLGNAPAARPGQTTDLDLVYAQGDQFLASLNNDVAAGRITPQERAAKWDTYKKTVIEPAHAQAQAEAKAEMDRQVQRQRDADARAARTEERQNRSEDRLATAQDRQAQVAEDRLGLDREKASYDRGQDAVSNALKLLQYQVDPSFGPDLAGVYNRIVPGAFQPGSFTTQAPDLDAIAAAHVGPILDLHNAPVAQPGPQAAAAAPPAVPPGYGPRTAPPAMPPAQGPLPYQQPGATGYANRFGQ